jgi:SAM-dependent methyltransferase
MMRYSVLHKGKYNPEWVLDFYEQAGIWWGGEPEGLGSHTARVERVEALMGKGPFRVLDLGAGPMRTAAAFAKAGHDVTAVELSPIRAALGKEVDLSRAPGKVEMVVGDYYEVVLDGKFDAVCCWDGFGVGSDSDQRRLLRRISGDWLKEGGISFVDVFNTYFLSRLDGTEEHLNPLIGVASSVEMTRKSHFDPVNCKWIDEWEPVGNKEAALSQVIRCYSPADFMLLLEGTGLDLIRTECSEDAFDLPGSRLQAKDCSLKDVYSYLALLRKI